MAKAILVIGRPKAGKTTSVKNLLKNIPGEKFIYDVNNEYTGQGKLIPMIEFLDVATLKTNTTIVFEEATIFFSNRGDERKLKEILVRKRHTNNIVIFCFHSLRSVPTYVLDLTDYYILHKTNDNINLIEKKFSGNDVLLSDFKKVGQSENPHFRVVRQLL